MDLTFKIENTEAITMTSIYDYKKWTLEQKIKTAKWFLTGCDRVVQALDNIEQEMMLDLLDSIDKPKELSQNTKDFLIFVLVNKVGVNWKITSKKQPDLIEKMYKWYLDSKKKN